MLDSADDEWGNGPGLIESVRRYKVVVLLAVLVLGALAYGWSTMQPKQYAGVVNVFLSDPNSQSGDPGRYVRSQAAYITSPEVLERAITLSGQSLTRKQMEQRVTVDASNNADLITIQALAPTPTGAAKLADAVASAYRQQLRDDASTAAKARTAQLDQVQRQLASELEKVRRDLSANPDDPVLRASEQAKTTQIQSVAAQKERAAADAAQAAATSSTQETAAIPDEPATPKPVRNAALGALAGLVLGAAVAWWLAGRRARDTQAAPERAAEDGDQASPGPQPDPPAESSAAPLTLTTVLSEALDRLGDVPDGLPDRDLPQEIVEEFSLRFPVETVAVLAADDGGLRLVGHTGTIGAAALGTRYDPSILGPLVRGGTRLVDLIEVRSLLDERLPLGAAQRFVVVPLVDGTTPVGVLLAGRHPNGHVAGVSRDDVSAMAEAGNGIATELHVWLLLQQLRQRLSPEDHDPLVARMRDWPA